MGVQQLRQSFNAVAAPAYNCTLALMDMQRAHDVESPILTFVGTKDTGEKFTISSRAVRRGEDVNLVAAETARGLLAEEAKHE